MTPVSRQPLTVQALNERLESLVFMVLTVRRSVEEPARALAGFDRVDQERFLRAVEFISRQTVELAYNFATFGLPSLERLSEAEWDGWIERLLDCYAQGGVLPAIVAMQKVDAYADELRAHSFGVHFDDIARVLMPFVTGLNGRPLSLSPAAEVYTDTETLYLPQQVNVFDDHRLNYRVYKATAVLLWAQTWFGTWRHPLDTALAGFGDRQRALEVLLGAESLRLEACIERALPGVAREIQDLRARLQPQAPSPPWREAAAALRTAGDVTASLEWLPRLYRAGAPPVLCFHGALFPERTLDVIARRRQRDKQALQALLWRSEHEAGGAADDRTEHESRPSPFRLRKRAADDMPDGIRFELVMQDQPAAPAADIQQLLDSIVQDLGDIPDDYLVPAGHGRYDTRARANADESDAAAAGDAAMVYDEWDYLRRHYRRGWCMLRERSVHPVFDDFAQRTRRKYHALLKHLYKTFEALRGEDRNLKRQPFGDNVDLEAAVEAVADMRAGLEPSQNLFRKRRRVDRDVAVIFLIDMSGSTKGWINEVERESLVLLCESLEILGDRYAIYGFSGLTHKRCELYQVKRLDEAYDETVRARISGITPQDYTRLGVFIRHATRQFREVEARTRLLITISDGRPDDQDGYKGAYGIEDTRQALLEARYQGIHPYCITIDHEAMEYLPHMYGPAAFSVINDVHKLPYKVSDIYRRITM